MLSHFFKPYRTFSSTREVCITGFGAVTALGQNASKTWHNILAKKSGIVSLKQDPRFQSLKKPTYAAPVTNEFDASKWGKTVLRGTKHLSLTLASCQEALDRAQFKPHSAEQRERTVRRVQFPQGVFIGTSASGTQISGDAFKTAALKGYQYMNRMALLRSMLSMTVGVVTSEFGLEGPCDVSSTACATALNSIGNAFRAIQANQADCCLAGGVDVCVSPFFLHAFYNIGALATTYEDEPWRASRPFDRERSGFVIGEGAGVLFLEQREHAKKRGAKIYGFLRGYGCSNDAHHIVKPLENGLGAFRAMRLALLEADITPSQINHINCHATSTPLGDEAEIRAIEQLIGNPKFDDPYEFKNQDSNTAIEHLIEPSRLRAITLTANKSQLAHTISASGGIESIILLKTLETGIVPEIMNLEEPISTELKLVRGEHEKQRDLRYGVKNAFAFGGINTSLVFENLS